MKIIVRAPNWIGDSILALPAVESIKMNYPQAQLWIAAKNWVKELYELSGLADGMIVLPQSDDLRHFWESSQRLKEEVFDLGILLTNSFSSAFLFSLAKIPERWGYSTDGRGVLLTRSVAVREGNTPRHQVDYYLGLISELGLKIAPPELKITPQPGEKEAARERLRDLGLDLSKPLVTLSPGAAYGPAKRWPPSSFASLASLLQEQKNAEILIIGATEEREIAEAIISGLKKKPAILTGETTLRELLGFISHTVLFISNDTGPMHLANALRVPVVAIFGPTDPSVTGPFQMPSTFIKKDVPCWPCSYRNCPYDHRCMTNIEPEEVFRLCLEYL